MSKRLNLVIIGMLFFLPSTGNTLEKVRVVVLPFEIYAQEDLSYLQNEIPDVIGKHLTEDGALVLDLAVLPDTQPEDGAERMDDLRNLGIRSGADHVIWGSLTWIGKRYSLDARMVDAFGEGPASVFFIEGEGIENLLGSLKELARNIGLKLFKREKVAKVVIEGNDRIEADAIKRAIKTKPGDIYIAKSISKDLKAVYQMGYFDDIRIESEAGPEGKIIIFKVKEKPSIRLIRIKGNTIYEDQEVRESLNIKTGSILNIYKIRRNITRIEELYKDKNYHNVKVTYNVEPLERNQADLEFVIEEGGKVRIKKIVFEGSNAYPDKKLKGLMKTAETGFFAWLTASGELNTEDLSQDTAKLAAFYHNNGYIQAKVGEPQVNYRDNWIYIRIKIDEGPQFKVGKVDVKGDLVLPKEQLMGVLKIVGETFYSRQILREDVLALTDLYSDEGYAYADVAPRIDKDLDKLIVNITYDVKKNQQVYFEKIIIGGNTKTRDKVIRRELRVYEQELYSGRRLKRSVRNLYRLDYFEDIKVDTQKGSSDDKMILKIDVTEKPTGAFSFGGGFSSVESLFAVASISQKNLFGRGQILQLKAQLGGRTTQFTLSFTEPWTFEIPLSAGFDLYNWEQDYDDYDKDSTGGGIRLSYPVFDFTRASLAYAYEIADITNIEEDVAREIKDLEGENTTSSVTAALRYDSRNRTFLPTDGQDHSFTVEYAGGLLGGNIGFIKFVGETGWYFPLFWETVGFLHGKAGYVADNEGGKLPDYERFYLGGINSVRGFDFREISTTDSEGEEIGGDKFVQFNAEFIFPLMENAGLAGVAFFDAGNVYGERDDIDVTDLRKSAGLGIRWQSPMGPIRLEYGFVLDPKEGEGKGGKWEFAMGTSF